GSQKGFGTKVKSFYDLQEAMETYLSRCYDKLRSQDLACQVIYVSVHTNPFALDEPQYHKGLQMELPVATFHLQILKQEANKLLKTIFRNGYNYKRVGVFLSKIIPIGYIQTDLFNNPNTERNAALTEALNKLNDRYGRDKIRFASTGFNHSWKALPEKLTQHFTTDVNDIIKIS
ncbi:MAG: DUF4113 domain-containing protein, partial [Sphingobacteriaceae bacterium]